MPITGVQRISLVMLMTISIALTVSEHAFDDHNHMQQKIAAAAKLPLVLGPTRFDVAY